MLKPLLGWIGLFVVVMAMVPAKQLQASHLQAGYINYTHVSGNQYDITLVLYNDCGGNSNLIPNSYTVKIDNINTGAVATSSITVNRQSITEVTPKCPTAVTQCNNQSNPLPGVEQHLFTGALFLPNNRDDFRLWVEDAARPNMSNIDNGFFAQDNMYLDAVIRQSSGQPNTSSSNTFPLIGFVCQGQNRLYSLGASDADGDSLVYELVPPQGYTGSNPVTPQPVSYEPGFTFTNPLTSSNTNILDPITGTVDFGVLGRTEQSVFTIRVRELRELKAGRWEEVGYVDYDVQIKVAANFCTGTNPLVPPNNQPQLSGINGTDTFSIRTCPGNALTFDIFGVDPDNSQQLTMEVSNLPPGATFTQSGTDSITGTFFWNTPPNESGIFSFSVLLRDNYCDLQSGSALDGIQQQTYVINFTGELGLAPQVTPIDCQSGANGEINLTVIGGNAPYTYTWAHDPQNDSARATNLPPGTYNFNVTSANGCVGNGDVTLVAPPPLNVNLAVQNETCSGRNNGAVRTLITNGTPPYDYTWPGRTEKTADLLNLPDGDYPVLITDDLGCTFRDTATVQAQVALDPTAFNLTGEQCAGDNLGSFEISLAGGAAPFSYFLDGAPNPNNQFSGLGQGTYTVRVRDANLCEDTVQVTVPGPAPLDLTLSSTQEPACPGEANGRATLALTGGTQPLEFSIDNIVFQPDSVFRNLPAATYRFRVRDANNCRDSVSVTVPTATALGLTLQNQQDVSCPGAKDGALRVSVAAGVAPFEFRLDSGAWQSDSNFVNLSGGTYTPTVRDSRGCTASAPAVSISEAPPVDLTVNQLISPSCNGDATGVIQFDGNDGRGPYNYWLNGVSQPSGNVGSLPAGAYQLVVENTNGCRDTLDTTLTQPDPLVLQTDTLQDVSCAGLANGFAVLEGVGGAGSYAYSSNGFGFNSNPDVNNLGPGNYTYIVRDDNNCFDTLDFSISQPAPLLVDRTVLAPVSCPGRVDGAFRLEATGGNGGYRFSLDNTTYQVSDTFRNLPSGNYTGYVQDTLGCVDSVPVSFPNPVPLQLQVDSSARVNCAGSANGYLRLQATGGTGPRRFGLGSGALAADSVFSGLSSGLYTVVVQDSLGCTDSLTEDLSLQNPLVLSLDSSRNLLCQGDSSGYLAGSATGGAPPYTFRLNGVDNGSNSFPNLAAGPYQLVVVDQVGCRDTLTPNLSEPPQLQLQLDSLRNVRCAGENNGLLAVRGQGGLRPYQYELNGGGLGTDSVFGGLAAGAQQLVVQDSNGCRDTLNETLSEPAPLDLGSTEIQSIACFGDSSGLLELNATGGNGGNRYRLGGGPWQSSNQFPNLPAGTYNLRVEDSLGCTDSLLDTLTQPDQLLLGLADTTEVACAGDSSGEILLNTSGGVSPYQWRLLGQAPQGTDTFGNLPAGAYQVEVLDANGCRDTQSINLTENPPLVLDSLLTTNPSCSGFSDGGLEVRYTGGVPPYTYQLNGGAPAGINTWVNMPQGLYTIVVEDAVGCRDTQAVTLTAPLSLDLQVDSLRNLACHTDSSGYLAVSARGGTRPYQFSLNGQPNTPDSTFSTLAAGIYQIVVTDSQGCSQTLDTVLTQPDSLVLTARLAQRITCHRAQNGQVQLQVTGGAAPYQFSTPLRSPQPDSLFTALDTGQTIYFVVDNNGCSDTTTFTLAEPAPLSLSLDSLDTVSCNGGTDGGFQLTASGGVRPYQWAQGAGPLQADSMFAGLPAGSVTAYVQDSNGCRDSLLIAVPEQPPLVLNLPTATNPLCADSASGALQASASGGVPPYAFALNGGGFNPDSSFINLTDTQYTVVVRDANTCSDTASATLADPAPLSLNLDTLADIVCGGAEGYLGVTASGGTAPYQYRMNSGPLQSNGVFANLTAGDYAVTVLDANNCQLQDSFTIAQPIANAIQVNRIEPVRCQGEANGRIELQGIGPDGPFTYGLDTTNLGPDSLLTGLSAGAYTFWMADSNGCLTNLDTVIPEPSALQASLLDSTPVSCVDGANGRLVLEAAGGVSPYQYRLATGSWQSGPTFPNLKDSLYTLEVRDDSGCVTSLQRSPGSLPTLSLSLQNQLNPSCFGDSTGAVRLSAQGGAPPYRFARTGEAFQVDSQFSNLPANTYTWVVQDDSSCTDTLNMNLDNPAQVQLALTYQQDIACHNQSTGILAVQGTGGVGQLRYQLNGGAPTPDSLFTNLAAGAYTLQVVDTNGCRDTLNETLVQPAPLSLDTASTTHISCFGLSDGALTLSASGGAAPYQYRQVGGAAQPSPTFAGLAMGAYTLVVADDSSCTDTLTVSLNQPDSVEVRALQVQDLRCQGDASGGLAVQALGGTPPYQFRLNGGSWQADSQFSGLAAGAYSLQVQDSRGCTAQLDTSLQEPSVLLLDTARTQQPRCQGETNGEILLRAVGGTAPYHFGRAGQMLSSDSLRPNLAAGAYTWVARDDSGCTDTFAFSLGQPAPLVLSPVDNVPARCFGQASAELEVQAIGGNAPYRFGLSLASLNSASRFSGLPAGPVEVFVQDSLGCQDSIIVNLVEPQPVQVSLDQLTPVRCQGESNGSLRITAQGGDGAFQFALQGGSLSTDSTFTGLAAGAYRVLAQDGAGCSDTLDVTVPQPPALSLQTVNWNLPTCAGEANGSLQLTAQGGNGAYQFSLDSTNWNTTGQFSGLAAGAFSLYVRDPLGCTNRLDTSFGEPNDLSLSLVDSQAIRCFGAQTGLLEVAASGGNGGYLFNLNGGPSQTGGRFGNLPAGTYTLRVRDSRSCTDSLRITLPENPALQLSANTLDPTCNGAANGELRLTATGGVRPYTYRLNTGPFLADSTFAGLAASAYTTQVRDVFGCDAQASATLDNPPLLTLRVRETRPARCFGEASGFGAVTAAGGSPPYQYRVDGGPWQAADSFASLSVGSRQLEVQDAQGCRASVSLNIAQPAELELSIGFALDPTCHTSANGVLSGLANGGVPPYTYSLNGAAYISTQVFDSLPGGQYILRVRDANGCQVRDTQRLTPPPSLEVVINRTADVRCAGDSSGSLDVSARGGVAPYRFGLDTASLAFRTNFDNLPAGPLEVFVRDANGCQAFTTVSLNSPPRLRLETQVLQAPTCTGDSNGVLRAVPRGGVPPLTVEWSHTDSADTLLSGLLGGQTYAATLTDNRGCQADTQFTLGAPLEVRAGPDVLLCQGVPGPSARNLELRNQASPIGGVWSGPVGVVDAQFGEIRIADLPGLGTYTYTYTLNGCSDQLQIVVDEVQVPQDTFVCLGAQRFRPRNFRPLQGVWSSPDLDGGHFLNSQLGELDLAGLAAQAIRLVYTAPSGCRDSFNLTLVEPPVADIRSTPALPQQTLRTPGAATAAYQADAQISPLAVPASYRWDFGNGDTATGASVSYTYPAAGAFTTTLYTEDALGCRDTTTLRSVTVQEANQVRISDAFSPNGDGQNDRIQLDLGNVERLWMRVYNRYGKQLFASTDPNNLWDGTHNGQPVADGVYYYEVEVTFKDGSTEYQTGSLTVVR